MWTYQGVTFKDEMIPDGAYGFIYLMSANIGGHSLMYIGKKNFFSDRKVKFGKKAVAALTDKRVKKYRRVRKTSYQDYYSSNEVLINAHKTGIVIRREILEICYSKTELSYKEVKHQFAHEVLEREWYLNGNILGKFYKNKLR